MSTYHSDRSVACHLVLTCNVALIYRAAEFSHTVIHKGGGLSKAPLPTGAAAGAKPSLAVSLFIHLCTDPLPMLCLYATTLAVFAVNLLAFTKL